PVGAAAIARSPPDQVARRVDSHIGEADLAKALGHPVRALALLARGRGDPRDGHLMLQDLLVERSQRSTCLDERLALPQLREGAIGSLHCPQLSAGAPMRKCTSPRRAILSPPVRGIHSMKHGPCEPILPLRP